MATPPQYTYNHCFYATYTITQCYAHAQYNASIPTRYMSITSPLKSSILSEAGVVAGAAARQTEERKHSNNDSICSELGWKCVPLVVETFGAWGKTAGQFFGQAHT